MRPYRPLPSRSGHNDGNVPYSRARGRPLLQQATLGGTTNSTPGISPVVAAGSNAAGGKCTGRALRLGCCCLGRSCLLPLLGLALVLGCQVLRPHDSWGTHARAHTQARTHTHTHTPNQRNGTHCSHSPRHKKLARNVQRRTSLHKIQARHVQR